MGWPVRYLYGQGESGAPRGPQCLPTGFDTYLSTTQEVVRLGLGADTRAHPVKPEGRSSLIDFDP